MVEHDDYCFFRLFGQFGSLRQLPALCFDMTACARPRGVTLESADEFDLRAIAKAAEPKIMAINDRVTAGYNVGHQLSGRGPYSKPVA
jgi:hypothetical protein